MSVLAAINMLGWTVFFGLSSMFLALSLGDTVQERRVRRSFMANGLILGVISIAYVFNITIVVFLGMFFGMGVAVLLGTVYSCLMSED